MKKLTARRILTFMVVMFLTVFNFAAVSYATNGVLNVKSVTLGNSQPSISTTYALGFTTGTTASLTEIDFQFATTPSGALTVPASLDISAVTLGSTTNLGSGWTLGTHTSGLIKITNAGSTVNSGTAATVNFTGIVNPAIADCNPVSGNSSGTCYVRITTINSGGNVDTGSTSFTMIAPVTASVTVDPSLTLVVAGVASSTTTNGVTTTVTSTATTLPFGNIAAGTASVAAQTVTVTTNAVNGYTVKMNMSTAMTGTGANSTHSIQPFAASSATWASPQTWAAPTGSVLDNSNPAQSASFIGANTSDTRIAGWASASGKFGPVNSTANTIAQSAGPEQNNPITVGYEIETDVFQPADTYTGTLQYNAVATY